MRKRRLMEGRENKVEKDCYIIRKRAMSHVHERGNFTLYKFVESESLKELYCD